MFSIRVAETLPPGPASRASGAGADGGNLGVRRHGGRSLRASSDVIDLVMPPGRAVGHDRQIGAVQLEAQVNLWRCDSNWGNVCSMAFQGNCSADPFVDVDVELGVASEREKQVFTATL